MIDKILRQVGMCIIVVLLVMMLQGLNITLINNGLEVVTEKVMKEYTAEDVKTFGTKVVDTVKDAPTIAANIVAAVDSATEYGQPIDELIVGPTASIYAVSGGIVSTVGEDGELGKYVKISHGTDMESVYGNCNKIYVKPLERVKKGQIIAEYQKDNPNEFYYTLTPIK